MIVFSIYTMPLSNKILDSNDYSSKVIYSAVTDTLFKYDLKTNSIIKNACDTYEYDKYYRTLRIEIRKDLFYSDGQHIIAKDYCNCFNKILLSKNHIGYIFRRFFKSVKIIDKYTIELLNTNNNKKSYEILSIYSTGCLNENKGNGPYYISEVQDDKIFLKRNSFYRKKMRNIEAKEICFKVTECLYDYKLYNKKEIQITNNTMTKLETIDKYNYICEKNYIYLNILFSNKLMENKNKQIRKKIARCINKEQINCVLFNKYKINNSFILDDNLGIKKIKKIKKINDINLVLGYNNFYPNKIIAIELKKQLESFGFKINLVENGFNTKNLYDLNIVLNHLEYISESSIINGSLFPILFNSNLIYKILSKIYYLSNSKMVLNLLNLIILKSNYKIPLLAMQGYYLKDEKFKIFNYIELNYEDL